MHKRNKEIARAEGYISIDALTSYMPHNVHTAEAYEAYESKLERWRNSQSQAGGWDAEIESRRKRHLRNHKAGSPAESSASSCKNSNKRKRRSSISSDGSHMSTTSTIAGPSLGRIKRETSMVSTV